MPLLELQLRGILDGDDALAAGDIAREDIEQCGLARAGAAADEDIEAGAHRRSKQLRDRRREAAQAEQIVHVQPVQAELANGEDRTVDGQGRDDRVDTRAVRQTGIHHGARFIDPPAHLRDDAFDDVEQMHVILEAGVGDLQLAETFDVDLAAGIDQDIGDSRVVQEGLERAQPESLVEDLFGQSLAVELERDLLIGDEQALDHLAHLDAQGLLGDGIQLGEIELLDQAAVDAFLEFVIGMLALQVAMARADVAHRGGRGGGRRPGDIAPLLPGFQALQQTHGLLLSSRQTLEQPPAVFNRRSGLF